MWSTSYIGARPSDGNVRQGALDSVMLDAIAQAADLPLPVVRRAAMFSAMLTPAAITTYTRNTAMAISHVFVFCFIFF